MSFTESRLEHNERIYNAEQQDALLRADLEVLTDEHIHEKWNHILYHGFALYGEEDGVVVEYNRQFDDDVSKAVTAEVKKRIERKNDLINIQLEVESAQRILCFRTFEGNIPIPRLLVDPMRIGDAVYLTDVYRKLEMSERLRFLSEEKEILIREYRIKVEGNVRKADISKPEPCLCGDIPFQKCTVPVTYVLISPQQTTSLL